MSDTLFHYTCADHGYRGILRTGLVMPYPQPVLLGQPVSWWTDLALPDPTALGLTRNVLRCDRTEQRFETHRVDLLTPWWEFARNVLGESRRRLEAAGAPRHWWVATLPVPAVSTLRVTYQ